MDLIIISIRSDRFDHEDQKTVICFYSTRVEPDLLILIFLAEINYLHFPLKFHVMTALGSAPSVSTYIRCY